MARLYLSNEDSDITGYKIAYVNTRRPSSTATATAVTNTTSGGSDIQMTATAGGTALAWITKPFASNVIITSAMVLNAWARESAAAANATLSFGLFEYTTSEQAVFWSPTAGAAELSGTNGVNARSVIVTTAGTTTTIDAGNRLVIKMYVEYVGTMGAGQTVTMGFDGTTEGADGDTFIDICEAIRVNEQQANSGTIPVAPGLGTGIYQDIIDKINALDGAGVVDKSNAIQTLVDDLGYQRDNL